MKRWFGHPLFITAAMTTWLRGYDRDTTALPCAHSPAGVIDDGYFSIVLNTNPYTYLGNRPLDLSPAATLDRGLVAVTFRTMKATAILRSLAGALRGGGVERDATTSTSRSTSTSSSSRRPSRSRTRSTATTSARPRRLHFQHVPDAVRLVFPTNPSAD